MLNICTKCKEHKEEHEFSILVRKNRKTKLNPVCKSCKNKYNRDYYINNPDKSRLKLDKQNSKRNRQTERERSAIYYSSIKGRASVLLKGVNDRQPGNELTLDWLFGNTIWVKEKLRMKNSKSSAPLLQKARNFIYDLETYKNVFTMAIISDDGKIERTFEISEFKNELPGFLKCLDYLQDNDCRMIGFNNLSFDYPILHKLMSKRNKLKSMTGLEIAELAYTYAQEQINSMRDGLFASTIPDKDVYIQQIDLFKIWHFDNKAKTTSLKLLEFNMRADNIEDLPYAVGSSLTQEEIKVLLEYNLHDVRMTAKFLDASSQQVSFREQLTEKYGRNFMNHNDTKIGKDYFIMRLEEAGIEVYSMKSGKRQMNQSPRKVIEIKDCLFDYYDFKRPEFQAVYEWFARQRIRETKGVFSDILEHKLGDVAKYAVMVEKRKKFNSKPTQTEIDDFKMDYPLGWIETIDLKAQEKFEITPGVFVKRNKKSYWKVWRVAETLNVVVDGFRFDFGVGGIHGSLDSKVVKETKKYAIIDADVSSMYPNLGISNRIYPEHLTDKFCDIYEDVYNQRKSYAKGTAENAMLKLALNGVYGDSNNQYSVFYDPMYTMKVTINGQLSLCLLAEKLLTIPELKIVQVNTDGITVACPRDRRKEYDEVCQQWQDQVKLQLEYAEYKKMFIRDCNAYIAVYTNGKVKRKGPYQYEDLGWHQNQSALVVPKAAEAYMLEDIELEDFIKNHNDKFDFMLRTKVPRSSRLVLETADGDVEQQRILRYYPSKNGGKLVKIMPPLPGDTEDRRISVESAWNVKTCNKMLDFDGDVDYDYYIAEARKLVIEDQTKEKLIENLRT